MHVRQLYQISLMAIEAAKVSRQICPHKPATVLICWCCAIQNLFILLMDKLLIMSLKIALILSVVLQLTTATLAISLVRRNKANIAWWLISAGFLFMAIRRLFELLQVTNSENILINSDVNSWLGVIISVLMLLSLSFIRRILNVQDRLEQIKRDNESRIFSAIVRTEEEQKKRFSRELHDGLGPLLSSIKLAISSVIRSPDAKTNTEVLDNTEKLIDESIRTVKEISGNLSPHVLSKFGLLKAVSSFIKKLPSDNQVLVGLNSNIEDQRYDQTIEAVAYRVICELISNTLKHAGASNIYIDIIQDKGTLNIKYLDDGEGFDYSDGTELGSGLGLMNIESRIRSVHGSYQFCSEKGGGFNANFVINI